MRFCPARFLLFGIPLIANSAAAAVNPLPQASCVGWNKVATITTRGKTEDEGFNGTITQTLDTRTGRYIVVGDYGIYKVADGFDGQFDWSQDWSGASHYLNSRAAQSISITRAWLRRRAWCQSNLDQAEITALPDKIDGSTAETVWRVTPMNGIAAVLSFARATGLLRSSEIRMQFNVSIRRYDDWKDIGAGVLFPITQRSGDPDEDATVSTVTAAKYDARQRPSSLFAKPAQPRDYRILGSAKSATVPYEDGGRGRIYVSVFIDDQGPFPFEVDTGGHLIITPETAAEVHLSPVGNISNTGGGPGIDHSGLVRTREIRIGSAIIQTQIANVLAISKIGNDRGARAPRAGILGLELFERFAVQLDRTAKTLTLTPLERFKGTKGVRTIAIRFTDDSPEAVGTFNGVSGDFMLDTGDAAPAIIYGYWAEEHGLSKHLSQGVQWSGVGVGGEFPVRLSRGDFTLGFLRLPREAVSYTGIGKHGNSSTHTLAGIIGESSLYRFNMTYDYGHEVVWIDPEPKVPERAYNRAGLELKRDATGMFEITIVAPNSAGAIAGLKTGDVISSINSQPVSQLAPSDALVIFSGPIGSDVDLLVTPKDGGAARLMHIQLTELLP
ncbi:MAG TPA: PDZ domain-containing protein [Steroidobacteraceae bacterium]